ncbi:uncharacterized protein LOC128246913 [Mya arenaria]|uniref:uncharacterized protein LOC128246913 n=1 Tax=Mya arenaria TaxID=6604 RepID=UPI0022DF7B29|nr:uncharacterized protein LOC128246913 [Mya arenaria]
MGLYLMLVLLICLINGLYTASLQVVDVSLQTEHTNDRHQHHHKITLKHFSEHTLCKNIRGKIKFLTALDDYFQNISDNMRINFVIDLCSRRDDMLIDWVKEIFDKDGDGYISHFERIYYDSRR